MPSIRPDYYYDDDYCVRWAHELTTRCGWLSFSLTANINQELRKERKWRRKEGKEEKWLSRPKFKVRRRECCVNFRLNEGNIADKIPDFGGSLVE